MAVVARDVAVLVDEFDMTRYFNEFEFEREGEDVDVSTFGSRVRRYLSGPQETTITLNGFYEGGKNEVDDVFHRRFGQEADILITLCPNTYLAGRACYLVPTAQVTYNISAEVEDAVEIEGEFRANGFVDRGHILQTLTTITTTGVGPYTGTSPVLNTETAATTKGATAHLHVTGVTGTPTSVVVVVEHSVDGTTWAPLITFASTTAAGAQRRVTVPNATVNAQLRASYTITGGTTPTLSYAVAVSRGF